MTSSRLPPPRARRDRKRTAGLALATLASLAALLLLPGLARAQASAANGLNLYSDTAGFSGQNFTSACSNCHGTVQQLRTQRFGSTAWGNVTFDQAGTRIVNGINRVNDMRQFSALSQQQVEDLAAYISDVPRTSVDTLAFTAPVVGAEQTDTFTLTHAVTAGAGEGLQVTGTTLGGGAAGPSNTVNGFTVATNGCAGRTLAAGASCTVTVRYVASAAPASVALALQLRIGSSNFSRTVALQGSVTGVAPPPSGPPTPAPSGGGGGGALALGWLAALAAAAAALTRRRRAAPSR